ncbi:LysR family substrate-binding domain-containing protein [Nocardioides sp. GXZ039]|uniref:LysR family substrate-binding domain-containing protein n=1 Tax=Nocardioides sp. GXZ039 TaxID=3136018 RepID=UPI0030F3F443
MSSSTTSLRVGFVTGTTPDKWARNWRDRRAEPLDLVPITEDQQEPMLLDGSLDMALVRLPIGRDGVHLIPLYDEVAVAVAGTEHLIAAADEVELADLSDEQLVLPHRSGWVPAAPQLDWPPMTPKEAIETVAAGTGVVIVPASVARLHSRRDVVARPVTDLAPTSVGLAWLIDRDDELCQAFVGVVRGRSARSSRT